MRPIPLPVFRIEAEGEPASPYPSLASAMQLSPQGREAYIATSVDGVHLADAVPSAGAGTMLLWRLTLAGKDVRDREGWRHVPNGIEVDVASGVALREDFDRVAS